MRTLFSTANCLVGLNWYVAFLSPLDCTYTYVFMLHVYTCIEFAFACIRYTMSVHTFINWLLALPMPATACVFLLLASMLLYNVGIHSFTHCICLHLETLRDTNMSVLSLQKSVHSLLYNVCYDSFTHCSTYTYICLYVCCFCICSLHIHKLTASVTRACNSTYVCMLIDS